MTRSRWKGPFITKELLKKLKLAINKHNEIYTSDRSTGIVPKLLGATIHVYNGKTFNKIQIKEPMIGKKLGEFSPTRKKFTFKKKKL